MTTERTLGGRKQGDTPAVSTKRSGLERNSRVCRRCRQGWRKKYYDFLKPLVLPLQACFLRLSERGRNTFLPARFVAWAGISLIQTHSFSTFVS